MYHRRGCHTKVNDREAKILIAKTKEFYWNVDRTLSGDFDLKVTAGTDTKQYGTCDSYNKVIDLNFPRYLSEALNEREYVMLARGVNYHELAHFMFTLDNLRHEKSAKLFEYIGRLNDIRDENLFVAHHPLAKRYFRYVTFRLIINPSAVSGGAAKAISDPHNFILVYGRRAYLPPEVVERWERLFLAVNGEEKTEKVKNIINKYMTATESQQTIDLAQELYDLLGGAELPGITPDTHTPDTHRKRKRSDRSDVEKVKEMLEKEKMLEKLPKKIHVRMVTTGAGVI